MTGPILPVTLVLPTIPVTCYAGTGLDFTVAVLDGANAPVNATAIDSARAQVRLRWDSPEVLHTWTTDDPTAMEIVGTTAAGVHIIATGQETAVWQQQWARLDVFWDVEIIDIDGEPHRLCAMSTFTVRPEITQNDPE